MNLILLAGGTTTHSPYSSTSLLQIPTPSLFSSTSLLQIATRSLFSSTSLLQIATRSLFSNTSLLQTSPIVPLHWPGRLNEVARLCRDGRWRGAERVDSDELVT